MRSQTAGKSGRPFPSKLTSSPSKTPRAGQLLPLGGKRGHVPAARTADSEVAGSDNRSEAVPLELERPLAARRNLTRACQHGSREWPHLAEYPSWTWPLRRLGGASWVE